MKQFITVAVVILLSAMLAMPAVAKNDKVNADRSKAYEEAAKIKEKREKTREKVDKLMKERLKLIKQDSEGNLGPVGEQ